MLTSVAEEVFAPLGVNLEELLGLLRHLTGVYVSRGVHSARHIHRVPPDVEKGLKRLGECFNIHRHNSSHSLISFQ